MGVKSHQHVAVETAKGFTLVELLIAVSLIAILTGVLLAVLNPRGIQAKARDSQRISDLAKIKVALESYFSDNRSYPISASSNWVLVSTVAALSSGYINIIPSDPKVVGTVCGAKQGYVYRSDGSKYLLAVNMELASSAQAVCPTGYTTFCVGCVFSGGYGYYAIAD